MEHAYPDLLPCGFRYEIHKTVTESDLRLWAGLAGERYPIYGASALAQQAALSHSVVHNTYITVLIGATVARLAAHLPPPGAAMATLTVHFAAPVLIGTTLCVAVTVIEWDAVACLYWLDVRVTRADGTLTLTGKAGLRPQMTLLTVG
jgi:acyl dehydratase